MINQEVAANAAKPDTVSPLVLPNFGLPEDTPLQAVHHGWLSVGALKFQTADKQSKHCLSLQQIMLTPGDTITDIEKSLAKYRNVHKEMVAIGQKFRSFITDRVFSPSLNIEAEYSPNKYEPYLIAEKTLLDKKVEAEKKASDAANKQKEEQQYRAHIKNQYEDIVADFRIRAANEINTMYLSWLKGGVKQPEISMLKKTLSEMNFKAGAKFVRRLVSDTEATAIFQSIPAPSLQELRKEALKMCDDKFMSYQHDLQLSDISTVQASAEQSIADIKHEAEQNIAINTLEAVSTPIVAIEPEGRRIKKTVEVVVEGTEGWAISVISAFLRTPDCRQFLLVKKWENLSVGQMAAAIGKYSTETGDQLHGLSYREVLK